MMNFKRDEEWLDHTLEDLKTVGYCVIENVIPEAELKEAKTRMYQVQENILREVGREKLERANEVGILRLMILHDPWFIKFLEHPLIQAIVDKTISETAILHLQNGFINPPLSHSVEAVAQYNFHRDFPRLLNGYLASINVFIAITEFTKDNGATRVIPGTQQKICSLSPGAMLKKAISLECQAGSLIVFDSTLLHAGGKNVAARDRLGINHQFVRSYIKQQIDYVRALGNERVEKQLPRVQQLLGYYTRVVTSLDEYYRPEQERLYRKGQG